jgi:hypothetical protein
MHNTLDVKRCCEVKLGVSFRPGHECNGWVEINGQKAARITVPKGRKPIPPKTYKSMARQLKLTVSEFDRLLRCPLTADEYIRIALDRSV